MKKVATFFLVLALVFVLSGTGMLGGCGGEAKVPTVSMVNPGSGRVGETLSVTITGTDLDEASQVSFGSGVTCGSFTANSDTQITASVVISSSATEGSRTVTVTTPDGDAIKTAAFMVISPLAPSVSGISPDSGAEEESLSVTISGTNFIAVTDVSLGEGITVSYTVASETQISANIDIARNATVGLRDVSVTNSAGTGVASGIFAVTWTAELQAIIEGAEEEGSVNIMHSSLVTEASISRMEREIKEMFGVSLNIHHTPSGAMAKNLEDALLELHAGITPSYDLMRTNYDFIPPALDEGLYELVDWAPLITGDTNPEAVVTDPDFLSPFLVIDTEFDAIGYNPNMWSKDEAPTSYYDLADPKYKNEVGVVSYSSWWAGTAFSLGGGTEQGKDQVYDLLRDILDNGATIGRYADLLQRYLIGEVSIYLCNTKYYLAAKDAGVPVAFNFPDLASIERGFAAVRTGCPHPNAAKLVAVYIASPAGAKWATEEAKGGTILYPGSEQGDAIAEARARGVQVEYAESSDVLEFVSGPLLPLWQAEADEILMG